MNIFVDFVAEKLSLIFLAGGIILPAFLLFIFVIYEIARVLQSKKRKRRADVLNRWRRIKKSRSKKKKFLKPLFFRMRHLRKIKTEKSK